jgi:hypothetical protein
VKNFLGDLQTRGAGYSEIGTLDISILVSLQQVQAIKPMSGHRSPYTVACLVKSKRMYLVSGSHILRCPSAGFAELMFDEDALKRAQHDSYNPNRYLCLQALRVVNGAHPKVVKLAFTKKRALESRCYDPRTTALPGDRLYFSEERAVELAILQLTKAVF